MIRVNLKARSIASRLARKGMTQNSFAREVGITTGFMSQLLHGVRRPGPSTRAKILAAPSMKGLEFDDLFEVELAA